MTELARDIALILTSVGGAVLVPRMLGALWKAATGRASRQRREVDRMRLKADNEAHNRRLSEEHASHLRRLLFEAPCVRVEDIPPYPIYRKEPR